MRLGGRDVGLGCEYILAGRDRVHSQGSIQKSVLAGDALLWGCRAETRSWMAANVMFLTPRSLRLHVLGPNPSAVAGAHLGGQAGDAAGPPAGRGRRGGGAGALSSRGLSQPAGAWRSICCKSIT